MEEADTLYGTPVKSSPGLSWVRNDPLGQSMASFDSYVSQRQGMRRASHSTVVFPSERMLRFVSVCQPEGIRRTSMPTVAVQNPHAHSENVTDEGSADDKEKIVTKDSVSIHTGTNVVQQLFNIFDSQPPKGYLEYGELCDLLDCMGIVMDGFHEIEFFHEIDPSRSGCVIFSDFQKAHRDFKAAGRFLQSHNTVKLSCALASQTGTTPDDVVRAWKSHDSTMQDEMDEEGVEAVLLDLGLEHDLQDVAACLEEFDADGNGKLNVTEFISMFTYSQKSEADLQFDKWMMELRISVASASIRRANATNTAMMSMQQRYEKKLDDLLLWYNTVYIYPLYFYVQLQILTSPFSFSFLDDSDDTWVRIFRAFLPVTDLLFLAHMCIKFMAPKESADRWHYSLSDRMVRYLRSWDFFFDFLIMLPLDLLPFSATFLNPLCRMNKLLLLMKNQKLFRMCCSHLLGPRWWRIANALHWWMLLAHIISCVFHRICMNVGDEHVRVVLTLDGYSTMEVLLQYLQCYSYTVNTMAGLSRGLFPSHDANLLCSLCVVVLGVFVYAIIIAVVTSSLSIKGHEAKFEAMCTEVKDILGHEVKENRLPESFLHEVLAFHKHVFRTMAQLHVSDDMLEDLPPQLKVSVDLVSGRNVIGRLQLLRGITDDAIIYTLHQCMRAEVYPPGHTIFNEGDDGSSLYFIRFGTCEVFGSQGQTHLLEAGDSFGEISLIARVRRTATVRTVGFCNLLVLGETSFRVVMNQFPRMHARIESQAKSRIENLRYHSASASAIGGFIRAIATDNKEPAGDALAWIKDYDAFSNSNTTESACMTPRRVRGSVVLSSPRGMIRAQSLLPRNRQPSRSSLSPVIEPESSSSSERRDPPKNPLQSRYGIIE